MILTDTSSYPSGVDEDITGYFSITSPDMGTDSGSWSSPDVTWDGDELTTKELVLRLNDKGNIQAGNYTVVYNVDHPSYTPTVLSRTFNTSYVAPTLNLVEDFDVFTPELKYYDQTSYGIAGYTHTIVSRDWEALSTPTGSINDTLSTFDVVFNSEYYDAEYAMSFSVNVLYEHDTYSYLSIEDIISKSWTTSADTPPPIEDLVDYLNDLKAELDANINNQSLYSEYKARYEYASSILFNIKESCNAGLLDPLNTYVEEFLSVTNNFVTPPYANTNQPIDPYNCICGSPTIYNSDGTLTGNRTLNGGNNYLNFADLNIFKTSVGGNDIGLYIDFANNILKTIWYNIDQGIIFEYNNSKFYFGDPQIAVNGSYILVDSNNQYIELNAALGSNNTIFKLDDINKLIKTQSQGNDVGLNLDFANGTYTFGDGSVNSYLQINTGNSESYLLNGFVDIGNSNVILNVWDSSNLIKSQYQNNDIGIKLDFANQNYILGNSYNGGLNIGVILSSIQTQTNAGYNDGLKISEQLCFIGDYDNVNNGTILNVSDLNSLIKTTYQSNDIGLKLDFANNTYVIGDPNDINISSFISIGNKIVELIAGNTGNVSSLIIDDNNSIIKTLYGGTDKGLKLDFANNTFIFGDDTTNNTFVRILSNNVFSITQTEINSSQVALGDLFSLGNQTFLSISDFTSTIQTSYGGNNIGLKLDFANNKFALGDNNNIFNRATIEIDINDIYLKGQNNLVTLNIEDTNSLIKSTYQGNDIGLKLDFANNQYLLGNKTQLLISENTLGNTSTLSIYINNIDSNGMLFNFSDVNNAIFDYAYIGDVTYMQNGTMLFISDTNSIINTKYQNTDQGLKLDFANTLYQFGQINGGNQTYINIDDQFPTIRTYIGNINNGISFEGTSTYKFGQITGGNTKTFAIDDAAAFGFQFSGTGITQATTGSASGQYLKVKVGGNDYVIELKNPS